MTAEIDIVTACVIQLRDEYIADGTKNAKAINHGQCEDFACELVSLLGSQGIRNAQDLGVNDLLQDAEVGDDNNFGYPFNREQLNNVCPDFVPPPGLSMDDLDHLSHYANFSTGTHIWTMFNGRHFDAEAPKGVNNFLELPFFQRIIRRWVIEGRPERAVARSQSLSF